MTTTRADAMMRFMVEAWQRAELEGLATDATDAADTYIYVVARWNYDDYGIVAAFSDRDRLVSWLRAERSPDLYVHLLRDGVPDEDAECINGSDFLEAR